MHNWLDLLQWPAMVVTIAAAFLVGSSSPHRRKLGFWIFLFSNLLWIAWGLPAKAYALVVLQVALGAMNVRGMRKNRKEEEEKAAGRDPGTPAEA
jgi:hypothetical protein